MEGLAGEISRVQPANADDLMDFFAKIREMGLDNEDEASKSIKQLDMLFIMSGPDRNILKESMTRIIERTVRGESNSHGARPRRRLSS